MALYTPGLPVRAIVDGLERVLRPEDVAADVAAAAGGWEEISGLPPGGAAGALLRKASGADGDAVWVTGSGRATLGTTHDATGSTPRAAGYENVLWTAPSRPSAAVAGDIWIKP